MKIHFISIGGSAMHSLALALVKNGDQITGSDDEIFEPSRSRLLKAGILPDSIGWFPEKIHGNLDAVILGMHARADNPELLRAKELGLSVYSYPEFIYQSARNKKRVVIGGSHGKTTCTSIILHVLNFLGYAFDYLVGASLDGFADSVRISNNAPIIIIEGDEYLSSPIDPRPKFILYHAHLALLTGIAWDHVNVFPSFEFYKEQFVHFLESFENPSTIIYCEEDPIVKTLVENFRSDAPEWRMQKIPYTIPSYQIKSGITELKEENGIQTALKVFGHHNLLNIQGAWFILKELGVTREEFLKAIPSFRGASRRMELLEENWETKIFLDFAHAPSKIKASLDALTDQFPEKPLLAVMELHTFSSLNPDFIHEYKGTMDKPKEALVYFNPHTLVHKKLPPLNPDQVRRAFGREDLKVFNDSDNLVDFLLHKDIKGYNLVFMSSGNFDGIDLRSFSRKLLEKEDLGS